jgi:hypothetical protein
MQITKPGLLAGGAHQVVDGSLGELAAALGRRE